MDGIYICYLIAAYICCFIDSDHKRESLTFIFKFRNGKWFLVSSGVSCLNIFIQFLLLGKTICDYYEKSQIFEVHKNFKIEDLNDDAKIWVDVGCMVSQALVFHPDKLKP